MPAADATLVARALSGDRDGFGELHRRYFRRTVQVVFRIEPDPGRAEDIVQDAYLMALHDLPRLRDPERFYPWLCRIAVNRAIDQKRRAARRRELDAERPPEPGSSPEAETSLLRRERAETVRTAVERLPEGQRAAVTLRYFDELPMRSIAEILGINEVTARTQVFRGLKKIGAILETQHGPQGGTS